MEKHSGFQSAVMLFWVFLFITVKFCSADSASFVTQAFPENEAKPEHGDLRNTGSVNHIEEDKFKSVKKHFNTKPLQPKPVIFKKPFIKVPPRIHDIQRISPKPSISVLEEEPVSMVKKPNFPLIPFLNNLFPIMKKPEPVSIPEFKRPTFKPIPRIKNSKFLPIPRFRKPIPEPIPVVNKPIPEFEKPISQPIPAERKPIPEFEKPISEPIPAVEKPIPENEKPIPKPIPLAKKSNPENEKPIPKPIPSAKQQIFNNEKPLSISKKNLLLPQLDPTIDSESLKLKESLFKKPIPKIPFAPKFKRPLPAQKPIPPP
ncbi:protein PELPK1-like [Prosopis cineraria]|uniref:protein PELPK1-like n=1 Tax=Prosopis cineraria TaxID=364024 RepID=UPI00240F2583|nr:protein PELPK1-like [Prosopis cineraria]